MTREETMIMIRELLGIPEDQPSQQINWSKIDSITKVDLILILDDYNHYETSFIDVFNCDTLSSIYTLLNASEEGE